MASVRRREDTGKWEVRYLDPRTGKHRSKSYILKKEAETYKRKVETEIEAGTHVAAPEALTLKAICRAFVLHAEDRLANKAITNGTYLQFVRAIDGYILPELGPRRLIDMTSLDVEAWVSGLRRTKRARTGKGLAPATIVSVMALMKRIEDFAFKRRWTNKRIVGEARKEIGPIRVDAIRTFSVDELQTLLRAIDKPVQGRRPRDRELIRCFVFLGAFCGLRLGEIAGLKVEHLDLEHGVVRVRHSLSQHDGLKGPKTKAGVRDVPLPPGVHAALSNWMRLYFVPTPDGLVFAAAPNKVPRRDKWNVSWRSLVRSAGLQEGGSLHFHALRHFAASVMVEHQIPLPDVARLLGHEHFDMTLQVYAHPTRDVSRHAPAMAAIEGSVVAQSRHPSAAPGRNLVAA